MPRGSGGRKHQAAALFALAACAVSVAPGRAAPYLWEPAGPDGSAAGISAVVADPADAPPFGPVPRAELCVTEGSLGERPGRWLAVDDTKMRAYVGVPVLPDEAAARFRYLGPTARESRLGSGEVRRQLGLKLRAQDACNLVYVMWRIAPEAKLVVSVKRNPGEHTSAACGNRGYQNVKPQRSRPVPLLRPGDEHLLRARMSGPELTVFVDGQVVWQGTVGSAALALAGPVGMRSDNARLEVQLLAAATHGVPACRPAAESSD